MARPEELDKIPIGVSSCLLGERVRYDGGHKHNTYITNSLSKYFRFLPFCPEMDIGLGTPREPVKLILDGDNVRCVGTVTSTLDVTDQLTDCANQQRQWHEDICGYIFKKNSPSCGPDSVKIQDGNDQVQNGIGIYAQQIIQNFPNLPVADEQQFSDSDFQEAFIQRVIIYQRWKNLLASRLSWETLASFHDFHKAILLRHDRVLANALSSLLKESRLKESRLNGSGKNNIELFQQSYFDKLSAILKTVLTGKNDIDPGAS